MSWTHLASLLAALALHALVLFGLRPGPPAQPLPMSDEAVEVSLIAAAPEIAPPAEPAPPEPASTPEPEPAPEPSPPAEPEPAPKPTVRPAKAVAPRPPARTEASKARRERGADRPSRSPSRATGPTVSARPSYRSNPKPVYPSAARRSRQEGTVLVRVSVSAAGRAASVALARSSGHRSLDQAALAAVRRWTFEPARQAGIAITSTVTVPVRFDLR